MELSPAPKRPLQPATAAKLSKCLIYQSHPKPSEFGAFFLQAGPPPLPFSLDESAGLYDHFPEDKPFAHKKATLAKGWLWDAGKNSGSQSAAPYFGSS
ncbi:hypothetical protein [Herbaspirillum sp. NPDC101396]|uniref:hypothetical protein n=1 Tax=Herbaspirillum sp. NPDC101396 TaxID=3364005 RepID=UPI00383BA4F6